MRIDLQRSERLPEARTEPLDELAGETEVVNVRVVLFGELKRLAGRGRIDVRLPRGSTVAALVEEIRRTCGPGFAARALSNEGELQPHVAMFLDGANIGTLGGTSAPLTRGQVELMLLPMFEGG